MAVTVVARRGWRFGIDIALYADVLRRHRTVVVVGVVLALTLAVLSYVRITPSGIAYRSPEVWGNQATLVLTQEGAPELRSVLPTGPGGSAGSLADTGRFASLIDVYVAIATSDAVVHLLKQRGVLKPVDLKDGAVPITSAAVPSTVNGSTQMMTISGTGATAPAATRLTRGATKAFLDVLHARQVEAGIPVKDRIQARVVKIAEVPKLIHSRSKALPILVLLAGLIATTAVAFTRDNLGRRASAKDNRRENSTYVDSAAAGDPDGINVTQARTALESVPDPALPQDEPGKSVSVTRSRPTLGSVPRAGSSATAVERDMPDEVVEQGRRR